MRRVLAAALAASAVAAAACDDGPDVRQPVRPLELPSAAQADAAEKLREAQVFLARRKPHLAEPLLLRVLELDPGNAPATRALAEAYLEQGRAAAAVPLLGAAVAASPQDAALRELSCKALNAVGDVAAVEETALAWTRFDAQNAQAWYWLGSAQYRRERFDEAVASFVRAEKLAPRDAEIRSEHGLALAAAGKLEPAEAKQRDALARDPEYAEAWFRLGDLIFRRDPSRAREAGEALGKAVARQPANVHAHLYLFRVARLAQVAADDPLRARGEESWAAVLRLHGRAQIHAALGGPLEPDEGASGAALREQMALRADDPAPRLAYARLLHADGRLDEAVETYRDALAKGATGAQPRLLLATAIASRAAARARAGEDVGIAWASAADELRAASEEAASAVPADAASALAANRLLAWVLLLQGRDREAQGAADAALFLSPDDVLAKKLKALARMHLGEVDAGLQDIAALGWL